MKNADTCDEQELVMRLRKGDYLAFDALYGKYALHVAHKIKKLVKLPEITEELHQEVFLRVWEQRKNLRPDNPFLPFLLRIARNISIDYFRKAVRSKQFETRIQASFAEFHCDVEEHIVFKETHATIGRAIRKLPPKRLEIFTLCKLEGKSYEEAAASSGVSLSTVKDHMHRAMRFLRDEMSQKDPTLLVLLLISLEFFHI